MNEVNHSKELQITSLTLIDISKAHIVQYDRYSKVVQNKCASRITTEWSPTAHFRFHSWFTHFTCDGFKKLKQGFSFSEWSLCLFGLLYWLLIHKCTECGPVRSIRFIEKRLHPQKTVVFHTEELQALFFLFLFNKNYCWMLSHDDRIIHCLFRPILLVTAGWCYCTYDDRNDGFLRLPLTTTSFLVVFGLQGISIWHPQTTSWGDISKIEYSNTIYLTRPLENINYRDNRVSYGL